MRLDAKNGMIALALVALLLTCGFVVGRQMDDCGCRCTAETAGEAGAARGADPAMLASPKVEEKCELIGTPDAARLQRLEKQLGEMRGQLDELRGVFIEHGDTLEFLAKMRPEIDKARSRSQRTAAVATLRNVTSSQAQVQASGRIDQDADGVGEYGGFRELSGAVAGRMRRVLVPPVLSSAFRTLNEHGEVLRSGYLYRFYLPGPRGEGIGEPEEGYDATSGVDPDLSETTWCCYAWPADENATGQVTLFMNQMGDVIETQDDRYAGPGKGPQPDAAFLSRGAITGAVAIGSKGQDGNVWRVTNR
jgi:hypothetical protein